MKTNDVTDANGQRVSPSDPDYTLQSLLSNEQKMWEQYWLFPTTDPTRLAMQAAIREANAACLAAANAIDLHLASPRSLTRLRRALKLWPSFLPDQWERKQHEMMAPELRRIARSAGFDYDVERTMEHVIGDDDED